MNRLLKLPLRVLGVVLARVVGPAMVYPNVASEEIEAAIHYYSTEEVNDGERAA